MNEGAGKPKSDHGEQLIEAPEPTRKPKKRTSDSKLFRTYPIMTLFMMLMAAVGGILALRANTSPVRLVGVEPDQNSIELLVLLGFLLITAALGVQWMLRYLTDDTALVVRTLGLEFKADETPVLSSPHEAPPQPHLERQQDSGIHIVYEEMKSRLSSEIGALSRRGNLNLALGFATAVSGLILLGYFLSDPDLRSASRMTDSAAAAWKYAVGILPRLSLVIFIEVFAYFFLKLYRSTLLDIKSFQNELTNVQSQFLALEVALATGDTAAIRRVTEVLAKTERNQVLALGHSTVALELARLDGDSDKKLAESIASIVGAARRK